MPFFLRNNNSLFSLLWGVYDLRMNNLPIEPEKNFSPTNRPLSAQEPQKNILNVEVGPEMEATVSLKEPLDEAAVRELLGEGILGAEGYSESPFNPPRRRLLPIFLFLATALSTFWVGAAHWKPLNYLGNTDQMLAVVQQNWQQGLLYMVAVLAILLTHEMGHFLMTIRYKIPASFPICIPIPFNPIGTMGAVIGMEGMRANRKEIFDIGLAGPLAGLVVAVPVLWLGVVQLDLSQPPSSLEVQLHAPLIVQWMIDYLHPEVAGRTWIGISQVNPLYMAGWVGMLITGLNMMPVSQLDGGHTIYAMLGRHSFRYVRAFTIVAIGYVILDMEQASVWMLMLILVIVMGIHHPPTADDRVELDRFRWTIGLCSLAIPILCFPLLGFKI